MTIVLTDDIIDLMAQAMFNADVEAQRPSRPLPMAAWENAKVIYRRRAEAAASVLVVAGEAVER